MVRPPGNKPRTTLDDWQAKAFRKPSAVKKSGGENYLDEETEAKLVDWVLEMASDYWTVGVTQFCLLPRCLQTGVELSD